MPRANQTFKDNTWVTATGEIQLEYNQTLKQTLPVLHITEAKETSKPDNPYVYRVF